MKVEMLGLLDYERIKEVISEKITNEEEKEALIRKIYSLERERKTQIVSAAGRLSRFAGDVFDVLEISENKNLEQNCNFIKRVVGYGHTSIMEHDYYVFAIKDVSPIIEQIIIGERFASFTIKSRREVDFTNVGFYTPDFHDVDGNIIENNELVKKEYQTYMKQLFFEYSKLVEQNIPKEDARFVLPYCYNSNILMGINAHTLMDMVIKFLKTKYANIQEVREFGEKLYNICKEKIPYIIEEIEKIEIQKENVIDKFLSNKLNRVNYQIIDRPKLLGYSQNVDDTILISAIARRYQYDYEYAKKVYEDACEKHSDFKEELMKLIAFESDKLELSQVNFEFQIPLSYAVLTHLTRHRTHNIVIPDFVPNPDLSQYKIPPKIKVQDAEKYIEIFENNKKMYEHLKNDYNICEEDLIYFILSGNTVNVMTNMDGKTLQHIINLRTCNKTQWETRGMAYGIISEINKLEDAKFFSSILGSTCVTQGICNEGKECCGKIYTLTKEKN